MPFSRYDIRGGAAATILTADITATSSTALIASSSGWPDGGIGPFWIVIDPEQSNEEKILVATRVGLSLSGLSRGADGPPASAHNAGAQVQHIFSATQADEANNTVHQTLGAVTNKGDVLSGAGMNTLAVTPLGATNDALVADPSQAGGVRWAPVGAANIAPGSIGTPQLADASVTSAKIADASVLTNDIAAQQITRPLVGPNLAFVNIVADAAGLAAIPTPAKGEFAFQQDASTMFFYGGTAWTPMGIGNAFIPHTQTVFLQTPGGSFTSATYVNLTYSGTTPVTLNGFVKRRADTNITVMMTMTMFSTVGSTNAFIGINDGTTNRDMTNFLFNSANEHHALSGFLQITGLAAATYNFTMKIRRASGTGAIYWDANDQFNMVIMESL